MRPNFGLEIRVEILDLEGDVKILNGRVFVTWTITSFCPNP